MVIRVNIYIYIFKLCVYARRVILTKFVFFYQWPRFVKSFSRKIKYETEENQRIPFQTKRLIMFEKQLLQFSIGNRRRRFCTEPIDIVYLNV